MFSAVIKFFLALFAASERSQRVQFVASWQPYVVNNESFFVDTSYSLFIYKFSFQNSFIADLTLLFAWLCHRFVDFETCSIVNNEVGFVGSWHSLNVFCCLSKYLAWSLTKFINHFVLTFAEVWIRIKTIKVLVSA